MKEKTLKNIQEKIDWAERSFTKINTDNIAKIELKHSLWSFLASFQQVLNYTRRYIRDNSSAHKNNKKVEVINKFNKWKKENLFDEEKIYFDILIQLRTTNEHNETVTPNFEIKTHYISDGRGGFLSDGRGNILMTQKLDYFIKFKSDEYQLKKLLEVGVQSLKKIYRSLDQGM